MLNTRHTIILAASLLALATAGPVLAQEAVELPPAAAPQRGVTVALLPFEADATLPAEVAAQAQSVLAVVLADRPGLQLVDRQRLQAVLQETSLGPRGLTQAEGASRVGKMLSAQILVSGRLFRLEGETFITAALIGTETTLMEGVLVRGRGSTAELLVELGDVLAERLPKAAPRLLAQEDEAGGPAQQLLGPAANWQRYQAALAGRITPTVAVVVTEEHLAAPSPAVTSRPVDPAVQTELIRALTACGVRVQPISAADAAAWRENRPKAVAPTADLLLFGEAFSEFAGRLDPLITTMARAEIELIRVADRSVIHAGRATTRDIDVAERTAGKRALQKAGVLLAEEVLEFLVQTLPADPNAPPPPAEPGAPVPRRR